MTGPARMPSSARRPLRLAPFRALRFSPEMVPDLATVTCPPYDVIGENGVGVWEAADPHNVVRLILPRPGSGESRYAHAARDLRDWLGSGILRRDREPALYVYEHAAGGGTALGLVGTVSLHDPAERVVLPHEDVFPGPVADRTELMAATGAQLEPILLTYHGGGPASAAVDTAQTTEPLLEATTADEAAHRIWRLTDPEVLAGVAADLAGQQALIADGHHRYAAYRALRDRARPGDSGPGVSAIAADAERGLAMLVDADRHPLRLGGIHRSVAQLSLADAAAAAGRGFRSVTALPHQLDPVAALRDAGRAGTAFVIADGRHSVLLQDPDHDLVDAALPADRSAIWRRLDASIACEYLLPRLFGVADADLRVTYHHDARGAVSRAQRLDGIALLLNPARHADVVAVAANGERMPRKSTSFGPKPRTGIVMRLLTD